MAYSAQTHQFLRWVVTAKTPQETKDLITAAIKQRTWQHHHTHKALAMSLSRSQWERAIIIVQVCEDEAFQPEGETYGKLIEALVGKWKHEAAWDVVFQRVHRQNIVISSEAQRALAVMSKNRPERQKILQAYAKKHCVYTRS